MADQDEKPVLSRNQLKRLAGREKMGKELLAELERLEGEGVRFITDYKDSGDPKAYPATVLDLLLAAPPDPDEPAVPSADAEVDDEEETEEGAEEEAVEEEPPFVVASQRDKALKLIRRDPDFMLIREFDFALDEREDGVYLPSYNRQLFEAWARTSGLELSGTNRIYWSEDHHPAKLPAPLLEAFREQRPSWLLLLRHPSPAVVELASKRLADPLYPEEVVLSLLRKRLQPLLGEYGKTVRLERAQAAERAAAQAEADHEAAIEAAWSSFFVSGRPKPPARPRHPRGVAESLGDLAS